MLAKPETALTNKRVLVFCEYGTVNGGENSLFVLAKLLRNRWQFIFALPCPSPFAEIIASHGFEVIPLCLFENDVRKSLTERRLEIDRIAKRVAPDLIHANSLNMSRMLGGVDWTGKSAARLGYLRDIIKLNRTIIADLNRLDRIVAVSQATADFHVANGLEAERVVVMHNGVDLDLFQPRESDHWLHDQIGVEHDRLISLSIGQIGLRKGWDLLLDAAERLPLRSWKLHFVIAGERHSNKAESIELEQELKRRAISDKLAGHVHFVGRIQEIHRAMNSADFLTHTARQEPFGRVMIEACAAGLPVIATRVGGTSEIFSDPENAGNEIAILFEKDQTDQLVRGIREMVENVDRVRAGKWLRMMAEQRLNAHDVAGKLENHYRQLTERGTVDCSLSN